MFSTPYVIASRLGVLILQKSPCPYSGRNMRPYYGMPNRQKPFIYMTPPFESVQETYMHLLNELTLLDRAAQEGHVSCINSVVEDGFVCCSRETYVPLSKGEVALIGER